MKISLLQLVLGTVSSRCTKKTVVRVTELVIDRETTRQPHQMDQEGDPHPQGRTTSHEPWGGQLPTQSCVRLFSWHICYLLCQEPAEEVIFSF